MMKYFMLFNLLMISFQVGGQNKRNNDNYFNRNTNKEFYKIISFGEKIDFGNFDSSVRWTIINSKERIAMALTGSQINDYVFQEPGEYEIEFIEIKKNNEECNHPLFKDKMIIKVSAVKLSFDFSKIKFAEKLERGRNYEDFVISIPVTISTKDNSITNLTAPALSITGIGTSLMAKALNETIEIKDGIQLFKYKVSGVISKETYLMFDFYDFNSQVQTYNLRQLIN
ncbi:hypothetical protein LPB87_20415 [Flavobacterium sp. EDS]|uniref:hypothetical protein n=1 Tax=Flavobacterium sp. EDS TaxID=2897328 RepID=UPI001E49ACA1|nr:hypothetical protein [Flavobacterium sp. EDS]MCD0476764.1 hypothetical protein [Flavobacterium sp. EDS]